MRDILGNRIKNPIKQELQKNVGKYYVYNGYVWNLLRIINSKKTLSVIVLKIKSNKTKIIEITEDELNRKSFFNTEKEIKEFINKMKESIRKNQED